MSDPSQPRPVPRAPSRFLVGNLPDVTAHDTLVESFSALARAHGPLVELDLPGGRPVLVSGYRYARDIWDDTRFRKQVGGPLLKVREIAGDGLFTAFEDEPNWRLAHDLLMPAFSFQSMRRYFPQMLEIADQLVDKWTRAGAETWLAVTEDMTRLTLDTIALCAFGTRFDSFARPAMHPFVDAMVGSLIESQKAATLPPFIDKLRFGARRQLEADIALMNETVDDIIQQRRRSGARAEDLLDRMLHARDPETGARLDDVNIRRQAITFLIAGHETTSGMLSFALHLLARHPEVLARARAEVDRVFGPDPEARPEWHHMARLGYIKQTLRESLRVQPTAPLIAREARARTVITDGYVLEPGQDLVMILPMLHRDPEVWGPDAEAFDPAHFDKAAMAQRPPHAFKGFGSGIRACIGSQFAMVEATLVLAMVLHRFDLEPEPDYDFGIVQTLTVKPRDLKMRARRRAPAARAAVEAPDADAGAEDAPALAGGARLTVLYGSNMGTAQAFAGRLADAAEARGLAVDIEPLDTAATALPGGPLAIVSSTYNGHAPDNARAFVERLAGDAPAGIDGLAYAVFGCGHSDWSATFQAVPRRIDARLAEWGATRLVEPGEGDAADDPEGAFEGWQRGFFDALAKHLGVEASEAGPDGPRYAVEIGPPQAANPFVASFGALPMRVLANRELQSWPAGEPARSTRHIEVALPDGVAYEAGDHLGIIPTNGWDAIREVAARFELEVENTVRIRPLGRRGGHLPVDRPVTLAELLAFYVELHDTATRAQVVTLAEHTRCPHTRAELVRLSGDGWRAEVLEGRLSVLHLLQRFTACALPFHVYLGMLPPLRPRFYSISSSPLVDARRCSITVGVVEGEADGRPYRGVCSTHLARVPVGGSVQAFVRDTGSDFRLPVDARTPTVMVGAGTGLAPFVGFLQARAALAERGLTVGPDALFFGCRHPERDFLYREVLEALADQGRLALYPAFSRVDGQPRTYVQDRMRAEADAVWALIEQGAVIYVCGDAGAMEPGVRAALEAIHGEKTGADGGASTAWLDGLRAEGRYLTDVWASS